MKIQYKTATAAILTLLVVGLTNTGNAAGVPAFYIRTDKASYVPGDSGTLLITIRNIGDQSFAIKNLTMTFSWLAFLNDHWDGNYTIKGLNNAIASGQSYNTQQGFTVPNDGRAEIGSSVNVRIGTDLSGGGGYRNSDATIGIAGATYEPLSLTSSILPIITIALLAVVAVVLALMLVSIRKTAKK